MILLDKRTEATSHQLFLLTVVAKGLLGLFQLATAAAITLPRIGFEIGFSVFAGQKNLVYK